MLVKTPLAEWRTVTQIAEYLQLSEAKIYTLARVGDIPASKIGNQWRFDRLRIDQWLQTNDRYQPGGSRQRSDTP